MVPQQNLWVAGWRRAKLCGLRALEIRRAQSFALRQPTSLPPSLSTLATQERLEVSRAVDHTKNLHSARARAVEYEPPFEARHSKDSKRRNTRVLEPTIPSHLRLFGEERKRLVGSEEKLVAHLGVRLRGKIIGLVVGVLIRLRANKVASTHRIPVLFRRSSKRRCLYSQ